MKPTLRLALTRQCMKVSLVQRLLTWINSFTTTNGQKLWSFKWLVPVRRRPATMRGPTSSNCEECKPGIGLNAKTDRARETEGWW